ncbi:MAG: hypothetical protein WB614_11670, partial [Pseudolabrys sp.]
EIRRTQQTRKFGRRRSMERFLQERNVVLYRRLRSSSDETERRMIIKLLVEEMDKFKMSIKEDQQDKLGKSSADQKH